MALTARHDPVAHRFQPDPTVLARAQRDLMDNEDDAAVGLRFVRQRWEEALGATKVAVEALREIYPSERFHLYGDSRHYIDEALDCLTQAWAALDDCSPEILGETMHQVLTGMITTHAELDALDIDRYDDEA